MNTPPPAPARSSSRFSILEIPGSGAQATVCLVLDGRNGETRALKVLRTEFEPESVEAKRVRDEGRILGRLRHPALPVVHERLEIAGRQVLVMDEVRGVTVGRVLRSEKALPVPVALEVVRQVADVVAYAYGVKEEEGQPGRIVHRDLSLTNILLGLDGRVHVLDFGLARAEFVDRESQTIYSIQGAPGFMAPEGLRSVADNPGLDVYSLGICAVALIGGFVPTLSRQASHHGPGVDSVCEALKEKGLPDPMVELLKSMVRHDRLLRPTMAEVAARIPASPEILVTFTEGPVAEIHSTRTVADPLLHASYPELAFLEGVNLSDDATQTPSARADRIVRRFLERDDWESRARDLNWLLLRYPNWTAAPFLEVLEPFDLPWWRRLRSLPVDKVVLALRCLSQRPSPELTARCQGLLAHRRPEIASLALRIHRGERIALTEG